MPINLQVFLARENPFASISFSRTETRSQLEFARAKRETVTHVSLAPVWRRFVYTVWSPFYNTNAASSGERVLIVGAGTGLDLDHLPNNVAWTMTKAIQPEVAYLRPAWLVNGPFRQAA